MQIVSLSFGKFPEISELDIFFIHSQLRLRLVLDIFLPEGKGFDFKNLYNKVTGLFPNLQRHKCWAHLLGGSVSQEQGEDSPFQSVGGVTDLAHLIEHIIIDLQSTVGQMRTCSGLTCGYKEPANRFDLFVECEDKRIATFSSNLAVKMMKELLWEGSLITDYTKTVQLAEYLYAEPELLSYIGRLNQKLGWDKEELCQQLRQLITFKFLTKELLVSNSGRKRGKK